MSLGQCSCPDCGTTLRVRDRSFIGRPIECPDCQAKLVLRLDDDRNLIADRPRADVADRKARPRSDQTPAVRSGTALRSRLQNIAYSPLVLAWALAIGVTAFAAILMLRPAVRFRSPTRDPNPSGQTVTVPNEPSSVADGNQSTQPIDPAPAEGTPQTSANATETSADPVPSTGATTDLPSAPMPDSTAANTIVDSKKPPLDNAASVSKPEFKPVVAPPPVKVDVEALLKQRLLKFATSKPLSRKAAIEQVEEMLGVPIRYDRDELGEKNLERPISIDLESTTVGGVLKVLLDSAGWEYLVEDNAIRLKPRQVADTVK